MFNIKRVAWLFIGIISLLLSITYLKIIATFIISFLKGEEGASILFLAWPIALVFLFLGFLFFSLVILSWKKIKKIDTEIESSVPVIKTSNTPPESPIVRFGILFLSLFLILIVLIGFLK